MKPTTVKEWQGHRRPLVARRGKLQKKQATLGEPHAKTRRRNLKVRASREEEVSKKMTAARKIGRMTWQVLRNIPGRSIAVGDSQKKISNEST